MAKNLGQILVEKAHALDSTFNADGFNDMGEALTIILNKMATGNTLTAGTGISISSTGVISVNLAQAEDQSF